MTVATRRSLDDLNVLVAGQGGDGSLTVVNLLGSVLGRRGFHLYSAREIASRAKGGHAAALLRASTVPRRCLGDRMDLLVAFDDEAVERAGARLRPDGIVVFDSSAGRPPTGYIPETATIVEVPLSRLAVRDHRRDLLKNSLAFGIVARIVGLTDEEALDVVRGRFRRLDADGIAANVRALEAGFLAADERGFGSGEGPWQLVPTERAARIFVTGNDAIALGFLVAGGRFFAGYPITPATEILTFLAAHLPGFGGVAVQAEDELAAINMALGASMTGTRAMTASSGPGIALMQEGVSHAGSAEIPIVIVDCQRSGPSTGMPTKPEQSDLAMLAHGAPGDFPRIVLAPGDAADCFDLAVDAVNLAQRLQCPVYVVLDQALGQDSGTVDAFDLGGVEIDAGKRLSAADVAGLGELRRYLLTDDGISPWAPPGTPGGMSLVTGNEHSEWGLVSAAPANRAAMMDKRMRKIESGRAHLPGAREWGSPGATVGLLGIGMTTGVIGEAAERLDAAGLPVACFQPRTLWPVPGTDAGVRPSPRSGLRRRAQRRRPARAPARRRRGSARAPARRAQVRRPAVPAGRAGGAHPGSRGEPVVTATYPTAQPIWCAGCGHFGVQASLERALETLEVPRHESIILAGIGCSGTIQNNLGTYGYHALHGRVLPSATGVALADPSLTVIAAGGDGDGYAIGMGHLVHSFRRNISFTYIVMNNAIYGLTKGQRSPTSVGADDGAAPFDAVAMGLSVTGSTFVARGFTRWSSQLDRLTLAALEHARAGRGFAFLEVLSPCVNYNDTYPEWEASLYDVEAEPGYDPTDRAAAFRTASTLAADGRMAVGLIYRAGAPAGDVAAAVEGGDGKGHGLTGGASGADGSWPVGSHAPRPAGPRAPRPAGAPIDPGLNEQAYRRILDRYQL